MTTTHYPQTPTQYRPWAEKELKRQCRITGFLLSVWPISLPILWAGSLIAGDKTPWIKTSDCIQVRSGDVLKINTRSDNGELARDTKLELLSGKATLKYAGHGGWSDQRRQETSTCLYQIEGDHNAKGKIIQVYDGGSFEFPFHIV